jgi:hypothetical protein
VDTPAFAFEILARTVPIEYGALFISDSRADRYVACATQGWKPTAEDALATSQLTRILDSDPRLIANAEHLPFSPSLYDPADRVYVRRFDWESAPVGFLTLRSPGTDIDEAIESSSNDLSVALRTSTDRAGSVRAARLSGLHDVKAAGSTVALIVSCRELLSDILSEAPSINPFWLREFLLRIMASLFEPLGIVDRNDECGIRLLTSRPLDEDIIAHQVELVLGRFLKATSSPLKPTVNRAS